MKLGKAEKITLGITLILVFWASISVLGTLYQKNHGHLGILVSYINGTDSGHYTMDMAKVSEKYKSYENLYHSDKKVFTYGYTQYTLNKNEGAKFHKELQKKLAGENLNYDVVVYKNPQDYESDVESRNSGVYEGDASKCLMENPSVQELDNLRKLSNDCLINACIIDMKKKEYIVLSRDTDYIIEQLKEHNQK